MSKTTDDLFYSYDLHKESSFLHSQFLFNSIKHLRLQAADNWRIYEIHDADHRAVNARIAFLVFDGIAHSPWRAPFGFIEIYKQLGENMLNDFFSWVEEDLKNRGVKGIYMKSYPAAYDKNLDAIEVVLKKLQYTGFQELSSIISVDQDLFEAKIKISERQKLRKAKKLFVFEKMNLTSLSEIYLFIDTCRKEKNQNLSMSLLELQGAIEEFPENFFCYRVYDASGTAAAAIVIEVNKEILYTFYYAHARRFDKVSPVVFLISEIYDLAQQQGMRMIDLGISTVSGKLNRSVLHFKKSIGGQSSRKLMFKKTWV